MDMEMIMIDTLLLNTAIIPYTYFIKYVYGMMAVFNNSVSIMIISISIGTFKINLL